MLYQPRTWKKNHLAPGMSEPPDPTQSEPVHAAPAVETPAVAQNRPHPGPSTAFPTGEPLPGQALPTTRSLSFLAGASLGLAVIYTFRVALGIIVSPFSHAPWLLPVWTFGIPLVSLVLAWIALAGFRVRRGLCAAWP